MLQKEEETGGRFQHDSFLVKVHLGESKYVGDNVWFSLTIWVSYEETSCRELEQTLLNRMMEMVAEFGVLKGMKRLN